MINPISGTKSKEPLLQLIESSNKKQQIPYEIVHTNKEGDYHFLRQRISADQITDVIICGGDGTVSHVAGALLDVPVNIGIIPMGSGNGLALAAGISTDSTRALQVIFAGKATPVDGFMINQQFSCMLCGLGFDAQVAHAFAQQKSRGLFTYVKQTILSFFTAPVYAFTIVVNHFTIHTEAFFISIANSNQFGNHVTIAPKASLTDGLLDLVVVNKMNRLGTVFSLLHQIRQGKVQDVSDKNILKKGVIYLQASAITIHNTAMAPLHIDGDPATTQPLFHINVIPGAYRLLHP